MTPEPFLYHATPLHYLPLVLRSGALYAQSVLAARGDVRPRAGARSSSARRDRRLGLADYVHLSLHSHFPLLADKLKKGYPHALLAFAAPAVLALPQTALLPYNTKAWRARAAFAPVQDPAEQACLLDLHHAGGRFPSLEVLVKYGLDLAHLRRIALLTEAEQAMTVCLLQALNLPSPVPPVVDRAAFPLRGPYAPATAVADYFACCVAAGRLLPPPPIPFD